MGTTVMTRYVLEKNIRLFCKLLIKIIIKIFKSVLVWTQSDNVSFGLIKKYRYEIDLNKNFQINFSFKQSWKNAPVIEWCTETKRPIRPLYAKIEFMQKKKKLIN